MDLTGLLVLLPLIAAVAALPLVYGAWRRMATRDGELQIWRAMHRRGLSGDDAAGKDLKLARAVRRCVMCPNIAECDEWLATARRGGLEHFCPNAAFFDELERGTTAKR